MDGAWTGHPDQNAIAVAQFPDTESARTASRRSPTAHPDLRPAPAGVGATTLEGTRAAVRTVIRYRNGVLEGRGASLLDGYMEDLATDRIYRLMIAQRLRHPGRVHAGLARCDVRRGARAHCRRAAFRNGRRGAQPRIGALVRSPKR